MYSTWSRNPRRGIQNPTMPWIPLRGAAKASHRFPEYKKLCKEEIEETKQTYLTNNPLNTPWFLNLNPFLIRKIIRGVVVDQL